MTINECRDILAGRYPNRTICVSAQCWTHVYHGIRNRTAFSASIWHEGTEGIDKQRGEFFTLDELLASFPGVDSDTDAQAQADAEVPNEV